MFQFGTTESNAEFYLDLALSQQGLALPPIPVEEYHTLTGNNLKEGFGASFINVSVP